MKRKYEAMIVIDTKGKEDSVETIVSQVGKEIEKAGAKLDQVDNLGKRDFPFSPRHVTGGHFINFHFQAEPTVLDTLKGRLQLNENIYQQYYQRA
jgi:small subunit ribosomal protein S6